MRTGRPPKLIEEIDADIVAQLETQYEIRGECWIWQGLYFDNGYGRISRHSVRTKFSCRAHIASYQLHRGEVPVGLFVCHSCDVKGCINPEHLWLGTNQQNQIDAVKKFPEKYPGNFQDRDISGANNPMYGRRGELAPAFGRTGPKHPMFGKHHTEESKRKTSESLRNYHRKSK